MTISFVCPQGHPLTAPDDMAGKPGKCPHCDTRFLIPQLEEEDRDASPGPPAAASGSSGGSGVRQGASGRAESIVFFCPNGHKLNGPASLRGKLGLCPHCQSKFRIPTDDEASASDGETTAITATAPAAAPPTARTKAAATKPPTPPPPPPARQGPFVDETPHAEMLDEDDLDVVMGRPLEPAAERVEANAASSSGVAWQDPPPPATETSRWYELFGWLWTQRDMGSVVDLRLKNGQVFQPTWFAPSLSDGHVGVFGVQADDGSYGITALTWDQIERLEVRGCEQLPFDRFE